VTFAGGVCAGANVQRVSTNIVNGPEIETSGVDVSLEYTFDNVMGGDLTLGLGYTHLLEYIVGPLFVEGVQVTRTGGLGAPFPVDGDLAGLLNRGTGFRSMPQDKAEVFVNYGFGDHNLRLISRYVSSYDDQRAGTLGIPLGTSIDSQWTYDVHYNWNMPWDARLSLSVVNATDEAPPLAYLDLNYDPYTHDPVGRVIRIGLTKHFN
jgi:outer membrane receptor protein involved in Fe transport